MPGQIGQRRVPGAVLLRDVVPFHLPVAWSLRFLTLIVIFLKKLKLPEMHKNTNFGGGVGVGGSGASGPDPYPPLDVFPLKLHLNGF